MALFLVQAFLALVVPKGHERTLVLEAGSMWGFLTVIAVAQAAMLSWRCGWASRHVLRDSRGLSLPNHLPRWGRPRRRDFWLMLIIAVGGTAGLAHAVLTNPGVR
jgi:hypothetical protein